ncbi:Uncharacterised protein [Vibrio cholerae]|nr:Uncharacterised protein [Vibrio cholerae]
MAIKVRLRYLVRKRGQRQKMFNYWMEPYGSLVYSRKK